MVSTNSSGSHSIGSASCAGENTSNSHINLSSGDDSDRLTCHSEGHAGLAVNPAALRSFGGERPRQMLGPQEIWIRHSSDDDSSGDEGYSETAAVNDREEEDADDEEATIPYSDDETVERAPARRRGRRGTAAAAAAPARARVFARRTEHLKVCDGSHPFILIENVEGMDEGDRVNVMEMLNLDCTSLDSVRTSFATRKRLYYANFDCQSASEWPDLEGSPTLSACLTTTIPAEGIIVQYLVRTRSPHHNLMLRYISNKLLGIAGHWCYRSAFHPRSRGFLSRQSNTVRQDAVHIAR